MEAESISNQKRLVRGKHWEMARKYLRARDGAHNKAWRMLIIAGPAPAEEIGCIRALFRDAHITAVDIDQDNLTKAIEAGADEVILCDVGDFEVVPADPANKIWSKRTYAPKPLQDLKFDVICLDLTGVADRWLKNVITIFWDQLLAPRGSMMV